jgi:hypothetical protein
VAAVDGGGRSGTPAHDWVLAAAPGNGYSHFVADLIDVLLCCPGFDPETIADIKK